MDRFGIAGNKGNDLWLPTWSTEKRTLKRLVPHRAREPRGTQRIMEDSRENNCFLRLPN